MGKNLITGGLGFIGSYVAKQLVAEGEEVVLFQRRGELPHSAADLVDKVKIVSGDISNWVHVVDVVKSNNIDCIYHVAAALSKPCGESPATCFQANIVGTFNVLEAARILGVPYVIYGGAAYVDASTPLPRKITNDTMLRPGDMYETSKYLSEYLGEQYHRQYGINFRGIRLPLIIGPGRQISYYYGDCSGTIERSAQEKHYIIHMDSLMPQGLMYVKDAAGALIALKRADSSKLRQQMYNVIGFTATVTEIADSVKRHLPQAQIDFDWDRSEEMKFASVANSFDVDSTAAEEDFGWQPRYLLDEAALDFINEVKAAEAYSK